MSDLSPPRFTKAVLRASTNLSEIHTFQVDPSDWAPGLIAFDISTGDIIVYDNPINTNSHKPPKSEWKCYVIARIPDAIMLATGDCTGSEHTDVIVGTSDCIHWLENPGRTATHRVAGNWTSQLIGAHPDLEAVEFGFFSQG
ncbi:hypothetical protein Q9L58_009738 [Maublancomyces gigas]|uniref:Uncharacterized protein n=1 Tax=Discina gigas TaxID=1032678 RepID=A0ABR3G631_9PEZI